MTGFVKTSGVKDLYYTYIKENHLFKDDYLYISYNNKLKIEKNYTQCAKKERNIFVEMHENMKKTKMCCKFLCIVI